jgi:branched-chain amino acid transport system substrate-binding protein
MAPVTVEPALVVPAGQPIRIAVVGPASGAHAAFVPAMLEAAQMAVDEHGPVHGAGILLEPFDDACDEEAGAEAARAIADGGEFAAVLGPLCSTATRGGLPIYGSNTLPVVSPGATDPTLPPLGPAVFNRVILHRNQLSALGREETYVDALPAVQAFYAAYQARTGDAPPEAYRHSLAHGYDAMGILLDALARAAEPQADGSLRIRRLQLAQEIRATSGYRGVTGEITFDVEGNRLP